MATVTYRGPDGKVMTGQTGNGSLPPQVESLYTSKYQQPQAQLQETQASTGAAGASAALSTTSNVNAKIETGIKQQQLDQQNFIADTTNFFDKNKGGDKKVSPQDYNTKLQEAVKVGISPSDFNKTFAGAYTNPNNNYYDTPEGIQARQQFDTIKNQIQTTIDNFKNLPQGQKGLNSLSRFKDIPVIGQELLHRFAPEAANYENQRRALPAQLESLVGAGQGSGVRVSLPELTAWSSLLPDATKSQKENEQSLKNLDAQLRAKFKLNTGLDAGYQSFGSNNQQSIPNQTQNSNKFNVGNYQVEVGQ